MNAGSASYHSPQAATANNKPLCGGDRWIVVVSDAPLDASSTGGEPRPALVDELRARGLRLAHVFLERQAGSDVTAMATQVDEFLLVPTAMAQPAKRFSLRGLAVALVNVVKTIVPNRWKAWLAAQAFTQWFLRRIGWWGVSGPAPAAADHPGPVDEAIHLLAISRPVVAVIALGPPVGPLRHALAEQGIQVIDHLPQRGEALADTLAELAPNWRYQVAQASSPAGIRRPAPPQPALLPALANLWQQLDRAEAQTEVSREIERQLAQANGLEVEYWCASNFAGGAERQTLRLAQALQQLGLQCRLRLSPASTKLREIAAQSHLEVRPLTRLADHRPGRTIAHLIGCHALDWLPEFSRPGPAKGPWLLTYQLGFAFKPVRISAHELISLRTAWRQAERMVFVSEYDRRLFEIAVGLAEARYCTIWNGTELAQPAAASSAPTETEFRWLWAAALREQKRPDVLVQTVREAVDRNPQRKFKVWVAGTGPLADQVEAAVRAAGLTDFIQLLGWQPQVDELFQQADGILLTSDFEGLPLSLVEAMHLGKPLVTTAAGGIPEIIRHESEGLLCAPGDATALGAAMHRVMDDAELARRLGAQAQAVATAALTLRESALRHALLYLDCHLRRNGA